MERKRLTANEGMVFTNGESYGKIVFLAVGSSSDDWHEITEAEYEARMVEDAEDNVATDEDYQTALREMGVVI